MSILGNRVTRSEDPRFITGTATFGEDVDLPGLMHVTFVRSVLPHARIRARIEARHGRGEVAVLG